MNILLASYRWHLMALAAAMGWGLQYAVTDNGLKGIKATDWVTYYFFGGAVVCLLIQLVPHRALPLPQVHHIAPMILCIFVGVIAQFAIISAILSKNATQASLLENAVPLFALLFSGLFFGNWEMTGRTLAGCLLMGGGLVLVGSS